MQIDRGGRSRTTAWAGAYVMLDLRRRAWGPRQLVQALENAVIHRDLPVTQLATLCDIDDLELS